jgi:uncharacterized protein YaeQ
VEDRDGSSFVAVIYTFSVQLADVDRGVYENPELRVARHPSESPEYMLTRVLAYCLEYCEGIEFTEGVSATDEPAVIVRDLTGRITAWIEVGAPDAERLHRGSKLAGRVAIYTHRDPSHVVAQLAAQLADRKIHRAAAIPIYALGRDFVQNASTHLDRRNKLSISVTERHLYLDVNGHASGNAIEERRL